MMIGKKSLLMAACIISTVCLTALITSTEAVPPGDWVACKKMIDNGPDKQRYVLLVTGEGYPKNNPKLFYDDFDRLVRKGLLGNDVFKENFKAFNVYVAEKWSKDEGTSVRGGAKKDTAFDITFNDNAWGDYFGAWEKNKKTVRALAECEASLPSHPDYILLLVNTHGTGHGGETFADYITVMSNGDDWKVLAHEMGHAIGQLLDEYEAADLVYKGPEIYAPNASTLADRNKVPWRAFIDAKTPVPTPFWVTPKNGIGVYVGGATYSKGTYRPSLRCRMNHNEDDFCAVCKHYITFRLNQKNPDPNTPLARLTKGFPKAAELQEVSSLIKNNRKTFGFELNQSTLLLPSEPAPLPFLTPPKFPNFFIAETYDKKGTKDVKPLANPLIKRSFPARGKKVEFIKILDNITLSVPVPAAYDPVKEGFGVRLYAMNSATSKSEKGLNTRVEKLARLAQSGHGEVATHSVKGAAEKGSAALPTQTSDSELEVLKKESKVRLITDLTAK